MKRDRDKLDFVYQMEAARVWGAVIALVFALLYFGAWCFRWWTQ